MNAWLYLVLAGSLEVGFTTCLKISGGSLKHPAFYGFLVCATLSFYFLNRAMASIPLGTAYAVWTGIGSFGTALIGMVFFNDPVSFLRIALLLVLVGAIVGLKLAPI